MLMNPMINSLGRQSGLSMVEVLVTLVILMVGLLGLAGLQMQGLRSEMESYQRVQALILMQDMVGRINANRANAANYASSINIIGTGDGNTVVCTTLAAGKDRDLCEWSDALKGAGETTGGTTPVGAMLGGRGCITELSAADRTYEISVAWQGLGSSFTPTNTCAQNLYGADDSLRRVVSIIIRLGNLTAP